MSLSGYGPTGDGYSQQIGPQTIIKTVTTVDATPTAVVMITLPTNSVMSCRFTILVSDAAGNSEVRVATGGAKNLAGVVTNFGSASNFLANSDPAITAATAVPSAVGTAIVVTVTGIAATVIKWTIVADGVVFASM